MGIKKQQKEKGFTIIEVVLVLAIAGLIFMMVFIALPALQRSQRDTQRRNDISRAITAIENYSSSNNGSLPSNWSSFEQNYLLTSGDSFLDPAGAGSSNSSATAYAFQPNNNQLNGSFSLSTQNIIYYSSGYKCDSKDSSNVTSAGSRNVALRMYLESGGIVCQDK